MGWFNHNIEGLNPFNKELESPVLSLEEKAYLREFDISEQFDLFRDRLSEISESKDISQKQLLNALDPSMKEEFLAKEYEELKGQVELSHEDYLKIKDFVSDHNLDIKVDDGNIQLTNKDGLSVVSLNPSTETGEVFIGEHRFGRSYNEYSGVQRGEFRLSDYQIQDIFEVYGPNSKLEGSSKIVEINGKRYEVPIGMKEGLYHGMTVRLHGNPDFSNSAVDTISIKSDAVVRESPSHKREATQILAKNYMEGKYPEGTFTPQQEKELADVFNGKKAETISGLTPHHVGNAEMQYVPKELHSKVSHLGGSWLMNEKNYFRGFERDSIESNERAKFTTEQVEYIREIQPLNDLNLLISRIDEVSACKPPKAIDSDKEVAALLEAKLEEINPIYLEAPYDNIQIEEISDALIQIEGLDYESWKELSLDERKNILHEIENQVAVITHRPPCELVFKDLREGHLGFYTIGTNRITINENYVASDSFADYQKTLDTLIHEGRHAYQDYNLHKREVHPRQGDISNWVLNEFNHGYQDVKHCGFKAYQLQPIESDARAFAEDVLKQYQEKIA